MNDLVVLIGLHGKKGTEIKKKLEQQGFSSLSFDGIMKKLYRSRSFSDLTPEEIKNAYLQFGEQTGECLTSSPVILDEPFIQEDAFDWFRSKITNFDQDNVFFFQLGAKIDTLLKRDPRFPYMKTSSPEREAASGPNEPFFKAYSERYHPVIIKVEPLPAKTAVEVLISQLALESQYRATEKTKDYPIIEK